TVDVLEESGAQRRIVAAVRPELRRQVAALAEAGSLPLQLTERQQQRLRAGESIFLPAIHDDLLVRLGVNQRQLELIHALNLSGFMRVPMLTRGTLVGALTVGLAGSGRCFEQGDLESTEALARRAALAIDNARLYRDMQDAVQTRDAFLASASHDLRTPVTTIKAMAQVLQRRVPRGKSAAVLQDGLRTIDETAGRITALIDELLDLSRLQSGHPLELDRRPCDLVALVQHAVETSRQISSSRQIRVESEERTLTGLWDSLRLERVIDNLLSNALKYSPPDRDVVVRLAREPGPAGADSDLAVLRVQDFGIGIPAADLPHIFERFYRARNVSGRPGSGIGLAGAREIVVQHGGTIGVESSEGKGTAFTVRLPLTPPDDE
ncbi:MAG TPA: HAMP domain-containing sensor histidine kinase, partial [Dehalococcoidia bacterium]|nr:HAMP domain-containing sensor histidine kinase [Dehalococcoidia bacterium]